MKNYIKIAIFCNFISLFSTQDMKIQENNHSSSIEVQKEQEIEKKSLYERATEYVQSRTLTLIHSKHFFPTIFVGGALLYKMGGYYTPGITLKGTYLSDLPRCSLDEITSMFKSLGKSAHAYLFQDYMLKNLQYQVKQIFNTDPEKIFLVKNNNISAAGENLILMPFKDAIDLSKKKKFLGVLAHEMEHFKNHHALIGQILDYTCFSGFVYCGYTKIKNKINQIYQYFPDSLLFKAKSTRALGIFILGISFGLAASELTKTIGNFTWENYFERAADSFTHENPIIQKKLISGTIDFLKTMNSDKQKEWENSWYYFFRASHPKTEHRIATLTERLQRLLTIKMRFL